jgi:hypothetical protein
MAKEEQIDKTSKEFESQILKMLLANPNERMIFDEEEIRNIQFGVMFSSKDLKHIILA